MSSLIIGSGIHAIGVVISDIRKTAALVEHRLLPALEAVHADAPAIEAVLGIVNPQAANIARVADAALALIITAIEGADSATSAGGINVTLDAQFIADVLAIAPAVTGIIATAKGK